MKPLSRVSIWPGPATAGGSPAHSTQGHQMARRPTCAKRDPEARPPGAGQHGAAPGTLPQELRAPKHRDAGGNHGGEKLIFFF